MAVPSSETLRLVWREWFGPGGARQRYQRSAALATSGQHVVVHRPGQVVALDTTILPVKVRESVFGEPVSVHLTLALDAYTHSLVAFRLTLVSDTSVDVAMLLRDVMMPLPLREDWGEEMEWPYPGVPAAVVASSPGTRSPGCRSSPPRRLPPTTGRSIRIMISSRPSGYRREHPPGPHDAAYGQAGCERAFGGIRSLLLEYLPGYTGVDVADRGADPEADAALTIDEMEHLLATWIVKVWQNRRLGEYAPCWGPGGEHSPNTLFAAAMGQGGFAMQIPRPELYYQLLPAHFVKIHGRRGVKIGGLWYDGPALGPYRDQPSGRGGQHSGQWVVHRDPGDARNGVLPGPRRPRLASLRWKACPRRERCPRSPTPASATCCARQAPGLKPRSDAELLPVLLDCSGRAVP